MCYVAFFILIIGEFMKSLIFIVAGLSSVGAFCGTQKMYDECKILDYKVVSQFSIKKGKVLTVGITQRELNIGEKIIKKALVDSTEASTRSHERLEYKLKKLENFANKNCLRIDDRTASL